MNKLIVDGKVAVLLCKCWTGWSTANSGNRDMLFDRDIVQAVINGEYTKGDEIIARKYPDAYFCHAKELAVEWVPVGTKFIVRSNDGWEFIQNVNDLDIVEA